MPDLNVTTEIETRLSAGLSELSLYVTDAQQESLLSYIQLLLKWNKVYNLTAIRSPVEMVVRHLLDSLAIAPWCEGRRVIDVGTGAGLPGVPLAIIFPDQEVHLLDSNGKKTRFLFQVKTALCLDNISVHHARVESFRPIQRYDAVLSRAFASLVDMASSCGQLLCDSGKFMAMKGSVGQAELATVEALGYVPTVHELCVPGLSETRHLVILSGKKSG